MDERGAPVALPSLRYALEYILYIPCENASIYVMSTVYRSPAAMLQLATKKQKSLGKDNNVFVLGQEGYGVHVQVNNRYHYRGDQNSP